MITFLTFLPLVIVTIFGIFAAVIIISDVMEGHPKGKGEKHQ